LEEALGREQGHLRVVGDRPDPPVGFGWVEDPFNSEATADRRDVIELDRSAERVADGTAEQAAPVAIKRSNRSRVEHACSLVVVPSTGVSRLRYGHCRCDPNAYESG
jgi:hypothetical protein